MGPQSTPVSNTRRITVQSQIVKQIGGKHRYFFDVRNGDETPFNGAVTITLFGDDGPLAKETFTTTKPIEPDLGSPVYLDAFTGPSSVHGRAGVKTFRYEATEGGQIVSSGKGSTTDRIEDL
jgi:hypothetical protein